MRDGLAQNRVNCIFQDSRSTIWLGTHGGGITHFDGKNFTNFNSSNGLVSNQVNCFYEQSDGYLLIGTSSGLSQYDGHSFKTLNSELAIEAIIESSDNNIWLACENGLINYSNGSFVIPENLLPLKGKRITGILKYKNGILIGSDTGLFFYDGSKRVSKSSLNPILATSDISDIQGSETDIIWVSTRGNGLFRIFNNEASQINEQLLVNINSACNFDDENVAIATPENGLVLYNYVYDNYVHLLERDGLAHDRLSAVTKDKWGNLWVATLGNGVSKFSGRAIQRIGSQFGLPENSVKTLHISDSGNIWFSHSSTKLGKYDGVNFFNFDASLGFPQASITKIFEDKLGRIWIGTLNQGLILKDTSGFQRFDLPVEFKTITDIESSKNGTFWLSSRNQGIIKYDFIKAGLPSIARFTDQNGLSSNWVVDVEADTDDGVWAIAKSKGLMHISSKGLIKYYSIEEGLSSNEIRSIDVDQYGNVWLQYSDKGLGVVHKLTKKGVSNYVLDGNLPNLKIDHIWIDKNLLYLIHKSGIDKFLIDPQGQLTYEETIDFKGYQSGTMPNINSVGYLDNKLWFGSPNGLVRIELNQKDQGGNIPFVRISKVNLLYDDLYNTAYRDLMTSWYNTKEKLVFKNDENDLGFEFQFSTPDSEDKLEFQWKLQGHEEEWSPLSQNNSVSYSNLPHGEYSFMVKAKNEEGEYTSKAFSFVIDKAIYHEWWFRMLALSFFLGVIVLIYKRRTAALKKKSKKQQEELEAQLSVLDLEQKALQLQMNPHFIFNSLNSIQALIVKKDLALARQHLNKFSSLMRSFLDFSRLEAISLENEISMLTKYLTIEQFSRGNKFDFEIIPTKTAPEEIKIPPMMVQVFVENAIIHGINHLNKRGMIRVKFEEIGNKILCVIDDNGIGRNQAENIKSKIHESTATKVIIDRLNIIHRNSNLDVLKIIDKLDEENNSAGTRVELLLPILNEN
jgi:sensor histidine kinase YesM/streptogramin lyase